MNPSEGFDSKGEFVCVNCGAVLDQWHCKVKCKRCGYFEDCSDGGNDQTNFVLNSSKENHNKERSYGNGSR